MQLSSKTNVASAEQVTALKRIMFSVFAWVISCILSLQLLVPPCSFSYSMYFVSSDVGSTLTFLPYTIFHVLDDLFRQNKNLFDYFLTLGTLYHMCDDFLTPENNFACVR
jgi:hypothetical protein